MFESRKNLLDEIVLYANADDVIYNNVLKPAIEDYGDTADETEWKAAAKAVIGDYIKATLPVGLALAWAIVANLFTEEDVDYIVKSVNEVVTYLRNMSPFWRDLVNGKRPHVFAE